MFSRPSPLLISTIGFSHAVAFQVLFSSTFLGKDMIISLSLLSALFFILFFSFIPLLITSSHPLPVIKKKKKTQNILSINMLRSPAHTYLIHPLFIMLKKPCQLMSFGWAPTLKQGCTMICFHHSSFPLSYKSTQILFLFAHCYHHDPFSPFSITVHTRWNESESTTHYQPVNTRNLRIITKTTHHPSSPAPLSSNYLLLIGLERTHYSNSITWALIFSPSL